VRNSSLVECRGADNDRGSSLQPKPWMAFLQWKVVVEERSVCCEAWPEGRVERTEV